MPFEATATCAHVGVTWLPARDRVKGWRMESQSNVHSKQAADSKRRGSLLRADHRREILKSATQSVTRYLFLFGGSISACMQFRLLIFTCYRPTTFFGTLKAHHVSSRSPSVCSGNDPLERLERRLLGSHGCTGREAACVLTKALSHSEATSSARGRDMGCDAAYQA